MHTKNAQNDSKIEDIACLVWFSLFRDGSGKRNVPSTPHPNTGWTNPEHSLKPKYENIVPSLIGTYQSRSDISEVTNKCD
jgi:hypothetical protein